MSDLLMPADSIRFTTQGDYACSWCGLLIPSKKSSRNTYDLQEWCSAEVSGLFCSESHAIAATNDLQYRKQYLFQKEGE
jgi:hypothetical protein